MTSHIPECATCVNIKVEHLLKVASKVDNRNKHLDQLSDLLDVILEARCGN